MPSTFVGKRQPLSDGQFGTPLWVTKVHAFATSWSLTSRQPKWLARLFLVLVICVKNQPFVLTLTFVPLIDPIEVAEMLTEYCNNNNIQAIVERGNWRKSLANAIFHGHGFRRSHSLWWVKKASANAQYRGSIRSNKTCGYVLRVVWQAERIDSKNINTTDSNINAVHWSMADDALYAGRRGASNWHVTIKRAGHIVYEARSRRESFAWWHQDELHFIIEQTISTMQDLFGDQAMTYIDQAQHPSFIRQNDAQSDPSSFVEPLALLLCHMNQERSRSW